MTTRGGEIRVVNNISNLAGISKDFHLRRMQSNAKKTLLAKPSTC